MKKKKSMAGEKHSRKNDYREKRADKRTDKRADKRSDFHGDRYHDSRRSHRKAEIAPQVSYVPAENSMAAAILDTIAHPYYIPMQAEELFALICADTLAAAELPEEELSVDGLYEDEVSADRDAFREALEQLSAAYLIAYTNRHKIVSAAEGGYYTGRFSASGKGYGFVRLDIPEGRTQNDFDELFIPPDFTGGAVHGDLVVVRRIAKNQPGYGKGNEGKIICIRERSLDALTGTLYRDIRSGEYVVVPDNTRLNFGVIVRARDLGGANEGDKVEVKIKKYPLDREDARGEITAVFGDAMSREANYEAILHEEGIRMEFPAEVLSEAQRASEQPLSAAGRLDLRDKIILTIDGADAKDLDDAISLEKTADGWELGVHIADVSHYVTAGSLTDAEAFDRGTSVYFVDKVVPMLPKSLSNGACSLNADEDKYAFSAIMDVAPDGVVRGVQIAPSIIRSRMRGVYTEVNDLFEKGEQSPFFEKYSQVYDTLCDMRELYAAFAARSAARGAMELESDEAYFVLDEDGMPSEIRRRERGEAERLIEQFMLAANESVATWLHSMDLPCVYRVHEEPDPEKIRALAAFAHNLGLNPAPLRTKKVRSGQLSTLLAEAEEKGIANIVSGVLLRSMMKAKYSVMQKPHFGLSMDYYCHFTSPIRRYPDLAVHRILKETLSGDISEKRLTSLAAFADSAAVKSTENEQKAVAAERSIEDLYKALYMSKHIGEEFDAVICSVTSFGLFARTPELCEGLIPITELDGDFIFDEQNYTLRCGRRVYTLGMPLRVKIVSADIISRRINMAIV